MKLFRSASVPSSPRARRRSPRLVMIAGFVAVMLPVSLALAGGPASASGARTSASDATCPWLNESLPISQRVSMLMSQMTLADKINEVTGAGTSEPYVFYISAIPSLCIPAIGEEDGPVGVGDGLTGVTQMPAAVSLAATFSPSAATQYGQVVGAEEHAKGAMVNLGPTINIDRDPRWGRSFEAYTEDPDLNSAMAVGFIDGVQSQGEMSHGQALRGVQPGDQPEHPGGQRDHQRAGGARDLPAGLLGLDGRGQGVLGDVLLQHDQRVPACQNGYLIGETLDQRWGFPGFVTSDYGATHSTLQSADAGMDQEMPSAEYYGSDLEAAVQAGEVSMATLNQMVSRILSEMFRFNEFNDPPTGTTSTVVTTPAHQAVSQAVAEEGTVLLKNSGSTLPLAASGGGNIAVIGPAASASRSTPAAAVRT